MAKDDLSKEPIVDALTPLAGDYILHGVVVVRKELKDIRDKKNPDQISGHYWQLMLSDTKRVLNVTTGDKEDAFGSVCDILTTRYDIGFRFDQDKANENCYKFKIVDFKKSLKS